MLGRKLRHWLKTGNHLGVLLLVVAAIFTISGIATMSRGLQSQRQVAGTRNIGDIPSYSSQPQAGYYLGFAQPLKLSIPSIDVTSELITLGKTSDGSIDTPKKPYFDNAGWYKHSPAPGQYGAAVIVGHVDSYDNNSGASVFYNLAKLKPGDKVSIERSDNIVATFEVYATRLYNRQKLPADKVYVANSSSAELRLITCAGSFDEASDEYDSNTVIFAKLVASRKIG